MKYSKIGVIFMIIITFNYYKVNSQDNEFQILEKKQIKIINDFFLTLNDSSLTMNHYFAFFNVHDESELIFLDNYCDKCKLVSDSCINLQDSSFSKPYDFKSIFLQ